MELAYSLPKIHNVILFCIFKITFLGERSYRIFTSLLASAVFDMQLTDWPLRSGGE